MIQLQLFSSQAIKEIYIVTENWDDLTNKDGSGLYFDLVRMIYEPVGVDVKIKIYPYNRASNMVKKRQADMWLGSYINEANYAIYPKYYFDHDIVTAMYKTKKYPEFNGIKSLTGQRVCWIRGYSYDEHINVKVKKNLRNDRKSILQSLDKDRFDIYLDAKFDMQDGIDKIKFNIKKYSFYEIFRFKLYPAFRNDKRGELLTEIWNKQFKIMLDNGSLRKLYMKHNLVQYYLY